MRTKGKLNGYQKCIIAGMVAHIIMFFGNLLGPSIPIFHIQNIFSFLFFGALGFSRKYFQKEENIFKAIFLVVILTWIQIIIAFICVGWDGGFQNFLFPCLTVSFLYATKGKKSDKYLHHRFIEIGTSVIYFSLLVSRKFFTPLYSPREIDYDHMLLVSSIFNFIVIIAFAEAYSAKFITDMNTLRARANKDELTTLMNRHSIRKMFEMAKNESVTRKTKYSITIFDIDDFKLINDTYGHNKGDEVLVAIGQELLKIEDKQTSCCRWGGEEFLIIHQYGSDKTKSIKLVNDLRKKIAALSFESDGENFSVTITAGIAFSHKNLPIHQQIDKADRRLYWGKRHGKNQTVSDDL